MHKPALTAMLALLISGCMIGPDYVRPQVDTPPAWRLSEKETSDLANAAWWEQFDDPVLNDLVTTGLRQNRDLLIATARIEEFAGRYGIVRAELFPQVGAGYEAARQRTTLPGATTPSTSNSYQAAIAVSWELDLWGRIRRQSEAARAQLLASEEARRAVVLSLVSRIAGAYINLRSLDRQLEIARATATSRGESYAVFQDRYIGGVISILELSQNKSQYEDALASIPPIERAIAQQENGLSVLLGRNPGPIARGRTIDQLLLPAIPAGLPSDLLERRPDILLAEQNLIAANALIGAAKAAYFPSISLTGVFGYASNGLGALFNSESKAWQYAAPITVPIFTAGAIAGQVQAAEAAQQQALFEYQRVIQEAFREVNDALVNQDRSGEQLRAQEQQVKALEKYSDTARLRYDNGYTSYIEVLDSERSLFNVQLQYTQTQQLRFQAMINLYLAMGGGWSIVGDPPGPLQESAAPAPGTGTGTGTGTGKRMP